MLNNFPDETGSSQLPLLLLDIELEVQATVKGKNKEEIKDVDSRKKVSLYHTRHVSLHIKSEEIYQKKTSVTSNWV